MGEQRETSLKGRDGRWSGMSDQSYFAPTTGAFETLRNCYVSDDGTEIRRMPPLTKWADPRLTDAPKGISAMTAGATTNVTFTSDHLLAQTDITNPFGQRVYVTGNGAIPDGWYAIVRNGGMRDATILVATSTADATHGDFFIERSTTPHAMQMVSHRLCVVSESNTTLVTPAGGNVSKTSVATWVSRAPPDWRAPLVPFEGPGNILNSPDSQSLPVELPASGATPAVLSVNHGYAHIGETFYITTTGLGASGVADATYYATVVEPYKTASLAGTTNNATGATGTAVLTNQSFSRPVRRKVQTDVADGRLLIAAAGEGVCYQAHVGYLDAATTLSLKKTRSLGVPKAILYTAAEATHADGLLADGVYQVAIAYKDPRTGEYGLISERIEVTVTGANNAVQITYHTPRAVMRECYGCSVVVFISDLNQGEGTLKPTDEIPFSVTSMLISVEQTFTILSVGPTAREIPIIESLPMGGGLIVTLKGITFISGAIASRYVATNLAAEPVVCSTVAVGTPEPRDQITFSPMSAFNAVTSVSGSMLADYQVPTSYGGTDIILTGHSATQLDKRLNDAADTFLHRHYQRWSTRGIHALNTDTAAPTDAYLLMPRGQVWFSEQGHPGIAPAINRIQIDRLKGYDINGLGRLRDSLIACTDNETYVIGWDRSPLGVDPHCLSTEIGCIAPSSMVQYDGGLAWLSERGPVAMMGGGPVWISEPVAARWKAYKRDSTGHMLHAFSVHDAERKLVLFFLRRDRERALYEGQLDDDAKSKVPCDEILVWSYQTGSWSFWELGQQHEAVAACQILCQDGIHRVAILSSTKLIYAFDETLRDTMETVDIVIQTKSSLGAPLERATKVGAVNLRVQTAYPATGFVMQASALDDKDHETMLSDIKAVGDKRTRCAGGAIRSQDFRIKLRFVGVGPFRLKDISLEVSPGG